MQVIHVGHPSYRGMNHYKQHCSYQSALADLLSRGVPMRDAHRALRDATSPRRPHTSAPNSDRSAYVEVTASAHM